MNDDSEAAGVMDLGRDGWLPDRDRAEPRTARADRWFLFFCTAGESNTELASVVAVTLPYSMRRPMSPRVFPHTQGFGQWAKGEMVGYTTWHNRQLAIEIAPPVSYTSTHDYGNAI